MIYKLLLLSFFIINCFSNDVTVDSLTLSKIKKMVKIEEDIAVAYKKYILKNGKIPANIDALITANSDYLDSNFNKINPFGKVISLNSQKYQIDNFIPLNSQLKMNIYDFYYTSSDRKYTKAPLSLENSGVDIILSDTEKYIVNNSTIITTTKTDAINKYYLDDRGILHWYDQSNQYKFSITNDLLVDESVTILKTDGSKSDEFKTLIESKNFMYAGQKILQKNGDTINEYLNTSDMLLSLNRNKDIGQTILKFNKNGGGMLVNGDIYIWGNNSNFTTGIGLNNYTTANGVAGIGKPVINIPVNSKAIIYDDTKTTLQYVNNYNTKKFFSSPLRPKFQDFFSDIFHSTCGVTTKNELYCSGKDALENNYIPFLGYTKGSNINLENMYRSTMFDGINYKAKKIFALGNTYVLLGKPKADSVDGYNVYFWGIDNKNGWAGSGNKTETNIFTQPKLANDIRFIDLVYTYEDGYKKIAGLDTQGNIYTWGLDTLISNTNNCIQSSNLNFCQPSKIVSNMNFVSIVAGQKDFIAINSNGDFYKISQGSSAPVLENIVSLISNRTEYNKVDDARIISADTTLLNGVVWINGKYQLKGDYFIPTGADSILFKSAISKIQWQTIRVIRDDMMCGIDINYQLYCWGNMAVIDSTSNNKTYMLPVFMANLHDENKDFLFVENANNTLTTMTSGEWLSSQKFLIKYPTYIAGFNYGFIFK